MTSSCRGLRPQSAGLNRARLAVLYALLVLMTGCASVTLRDAVRDGQKGALGGVGVVHQGADAKPKANMGLEPGDEVRTDAETTALIKFASGARVYVLPNTRVRIGSIFDLIGDAWISVRGKFTTNTEYVSAGSEGTEYFVRVRPGDEVSVSVVEGRVGLTSRVQRWPKQTLTEGQRAFMRGPEPPNLGPLLEDELRSIRRLIDEVNKLVPDAAPEGAIAAGYPRRPGPGNRAPPASSGGVSRTRPPPTRPSSGN